MVGDAITPGAKARPRRRSTSSGEGQSWSEQRVRRDLVTPDEVLRLPDNWMLLFRPGHNPLIAGKVRHYTDREFRGLFDA